MNQTRFLELKGLLFILFIVLAQSTQAQISAPGAERERKMMQDKINKELIIDTDSIAMTDTTEVFDPVNYTSTVTVIERNISIRDFCKTLLGMNDPEILLDYKPHTITDPRTYKDITIQLSQSGKLDIIR